MSAKLWAIGKHNLITIQTHSKWEQKVRIVGEGVNQTITGSGEGAIHWEMWTGPGTWLIDAWFRKPSSNEWVPSNLIAERSAFGFYFVGANDGGDDQDFNDAFVSAVSVSRMALESAGEFLNSLDK